MEHHYTTFARDLASIIEDEASIMRRAIGIDAAISEQLGLEELIFALGRGINSRKEVLKMAKKELQRQNAT